MKSWDKLDRALSGEEPLDAETAHVIDWVRNVMPGAVEPAPDQGQAYKALQSKINAEPEPRTSSSSGRDNRPFVRYFTITAAVAVLMVWGSYVVNNINNPVDIKKVYATARAQRISITLADGSKAILGPATRLQVDGRSVNLVGEAVFTVNKNNADPFTVRTGNTLIRVLGTTFGIKAYDGGQIRVAVSDGRVSVREMPLSAGDVITINNDRASISHNADVASMFAWTSGKLIFRDAKLSDIIPDLERAFDLDVQVTDPALLDRHLTVAITDDRLAEGQLSLIGAALDARITRTGRRLTLSPGR